MASEFFRGSEAGLLDPLQFLLLVVLEPHKITRCVRLMKSFVSGSTGTPREAEDSSGDTEFQNDDERQNSRDNRSQVQIAEHKDALHHAGTGCNEHFPSDSGFAEQSQAAVLSDH